MPKHILPRGNWHNPKATSTRHSHNTKRRSKSRATISIPSTVPPSFSQPRRITPRPSKHGTAI